MIVSTKGRYALRVMIDLAENSKSEYIPLKEIAERQDISQKYLECIMTMLSKGKLVDARFGKGGGYRLIKPAADYTIGSILKLTESSLSPVTCIEGGDCTCPKKAGCKTLPLWTELDNVINNFFETHTLNELIK